MITIVWPFLLYRAFAMLAKVKIRPLAKWIPDTHWEFYVVKRRDVGKLHVIQDVSCIMRMFHIRAKCNCNIEPDEEPDDRQVKFFKQV